jgi:hypothetical protein
MAAKQGLTAQLSQAGEDAKRAVLSRTHFNFFSFAGENTNTVCTIKSAPPRSPEVLNLLSTKSGWMYKRNEQHVWQARWCCVVPHTFLYYFDAHPAALNNTTSEGHKLLGPPSAAQQEEWNKAIASGYGTKKPRHEKRFAFFPTGDTAAAEEEKPPVEETTENALGPQQPAGIIDLECYTAIKRSSCDSRVLELAGDDDLNPDLRAFYFCSPTEKEEWMAALLNNRHAQLLDECDAYKQVCDGFSQQLQFLHQELDESQVQLEQAQQEMYRVRSQQEDVRRSCWRLAEDVPAHEELRLALERTRAQDLGVTALVQLLVEHIRDVESDCQRLKAKKEELKTELKQTGQSDQMMVQQLEQKMKLMTQQHDQEVERLKTQNQQLQAVYEETRTGLDTVQKALSSTKLEMTMHGSQQRNAVKELQQHKKILKREVLDLRTHSDQLKKELAQTKHEQQQQSLKVQQASQENVLLERYVEKMESQVQVQQNMMEMLSHSGMMSQSGSVYGGSVPGNNLETERVRRSPGRSVTKQQDPDPEDVDEERPMIAMQPPRRQQRRFVADKDDFDNKSHFSELTEDRTQRHFESIHREWNYEPQPSPRGRQPRQSPRHRGPPSFIIGVQNNNREEDIDNNLDDEPDEPPVRQRQLDTITGSSAMSLPANSPRHHRPNLPRSVASDNKKLSVAQRARLEADRKTSTPVRARPPSDSSSHKEAQVSPASPSGSANLWRRMEEAVMGPRSSDDEDEDDSSFQSTRVTDYTEEEKKTEVASVVSLVCAL